MGVISGVTNSVAGGYSATHAAEAVTATAGERDSITGKILPASVVAISAEGRERLAQSVSEPLTAEQQQQQEESIKAIAASRFANQGPVINLGYPLFNDPQTSEDAQTFYPLLKMTSDNTQASMDAFAAALHSALAQGQVTSNQYDQSDTSEAMALTLTQLKLHKLVEKYIAPENQQQAGEIIDKMIDGKVAAREQQTLQSAQGMLDIAVQYGTSAMQSEARDYLNQVKSGTARPQVELATMMSAAKLSKDMTTVFSAFSDVINNTPNPGNQAQQSIDAALKQLDVYRQQWADFSKELAA